MALSPIARSGPEFKLSHAVDMRATLCLDNRECALLVGYTVSTESTPTASEFWPIARRASEATRPFRREAGITGFMRTAMACVPEDG